MVERALAFPAGFPAALLSLGSAIGVSPGPVPDKFAAGATFYNEAGERGARAEVPVAFHPNSHHATLLGSRAEYDAIMRMTDPALIGWAPDTGHILRDGQNVLDALRTYQARLRYLHLVDVDACGHWRMLVEAICDIRAAAALVGQAPHFTSWLVLEEESELAAANPAAVVRRNRETLEALLRDDQAGA